MLGIVFGIIASLGQGLGYALIKRSYSELPSSIAFALDACFGLLLWVPFGLIFGVNFASLPGVLSVALLSALLAEAYTFYVFSKGELSLTSAVFTTYPLFTMFFSISFRNESLTQAAFAAAIITVIGVLITSSPEKLTRKDMKDKLYLLWPLSAAIAVGISDTISKGVIDRTDAATFLFALAFAQIPVALLYLKFEKVKLTRVKQVIQERRKYRDAILGAFFIVTTMIAFWLTFEYTLASIAAPLTSTYAVSTLLFAYFILKERLSFKDKVGVFTTIAGTLLLSVVLA